MTLKLIQVGLGNMGQNVGVNFVQPSRDFQYAGLVEINNERLVDASEKLNVPKESCYTNYLKAFQELSADAVLVSAISPVHYEICKSALEHNLHVLVEKPFVLSMEEALELVKLAAKKNLKLMVNQNYRFFRTVLTLKREIQKEHLGKPLFVQSQFFYYHLGRAYQRKMNDYILLEMSVHHIDMMRFLTDSNVNSVRGETWNLENTEYTGDPNVQAKYKMESGIPIFYLGSLVSKGITTPWEGVWRIQCEEGSIHLEDLGEGYGVYLVDSNQVKTKIAYDPPTLEGIHGILANLAAAIRDNKEPAVSGEDNLHTLAAIFATSESSKTEKLVNVRDFIHR
ncbi:Gfo/Idh/MocA family protein [Gracilibacillus sp. D59]|uniref:Gfo/Idh/MocA family protein n=1 Tax=Gracilibacillus sp. D59 TaxID=3457434 RepID=UPI003FCD0C41